MSAPVSLSEARADKSKDCRDWSVLECLKAAVRDVERGVIPADMVYIAFRVSDDSVASFPNLCAGVETLELQGLLAKHCWIQMFGTVEE